MTITPEIVVGVLTFAFAQGVAVTVYVFKAARYAGSVDQHLSQIDDHLGRLNGRMGLAESRMLTLEVDPKWMDKAIDLGNQVAFVGQQTQALLQDVNERRAKDGLPALWLQSQ